MKGESEGGDKVKFGSLTITFRDGHLISASGGSSMRETVELAVLGHELLKRVVRGEQYPEMEPLSGRIFEGAQVPRRAR